MGVLVFQDGAAVDILDPEDIKVQVYTYASNGTTVVSRAWQKVAAVKVRSGGAWVDVWPKPFAEVTDYFVYGGGLLSGYRISADGTAEWIGQASGMPFPTYVYGTIETWLKKGTASMFVVKATADAGAGYSDPTTGVLDQWLDCDSSPQWTLEGGGTIALLTITLGRVDGNGEGLGLQTNDGFDLETESGVALTDTTISVTELDTAQVTLNNQT